MSLVWALPHQLGFQPVGIQLKLPEQLSAWWGKDVDVSEREHVVLGFDTEFARKIYVNTGTGDMVLASIVLSGQDMMTGIHRPERCLLAQGWNPGSSRRREIDVPGFGRFRTTQLQNYRQDRIPATAEAPERLVRRENLCYYWFVGHTDIAATHEQRVMLDLHDRIVGGYNQRWAMIMISAEITKNTQRFGRDEAQTAEFLESFIKELVPKVVLPEVRRSTESAGS